MGWVLKSVHPPLWYVLKHPKGSSTEAGGFLSEGLGKGGLSAFLEHYRVGVWRCRVDVGGGANRIPLHPRALTLSRISSLSKIFPVLMLYRLWEEGIVASLDDPLERYVSTFTINNPLGMASAPGQQSLMDGLEEVGPAPRPSPVTLRRMASQLSGEQL